MGSGTTLAAAELAERVCYGLELDPKYDDVIVQRWQSLAKGWRLVYTDRVRKPRMEVPA